MAAKKKGAVRSTAKKPAVKAAAKVAKKGEDKGNWVVGGGRPPPPPPRPKTGLVEKIKAVVKKVRSKTK